MNVLIYSYSFAPSIGGVESSVMLLARGLAERVACQAGSAGFAHVLSGVTVVTRSEAAGLDDGTLPFRVLRKPGLRQLWKLIGEANVVHLAGPALLPLTLSLLRRKPVIVEHHAYQAMCPNGLLFLKPERRACPGHFMARRYGKCLRCAAADAGWRAAFLMVLLTFPRRWLCQHVAANVGIAQHVSRRLQLPAATTIYYGTPDSEKGASNSSSAPRGCLTFGYVGRLVSEKGLPLLLQAAARVREAGYAFHLTFIGDGPERVGLESMADNLGLQDQVTFTGFLRGREFADALAGVTAVVMPSVWEETAGLAAIEHMMRGRVVIAADIGGLGEIVDGVGLKFPAGDVDGMAGCMRRVLDEPALVTAFGARARRRALELFRQDRMVDEHLQLLLQLAHPRRQILSRPPCLAAAVTRADRRPQALQRARVLLQKFSRGWELLSGSGFRVLVRAAKNAALWSYLPSTEAPRCRLLYGAELILNSKDIGISRELYMYGVHEPITTSLVHRELKQGMNAIDIGANIGYYAILEAKLVGPTGRVLAIEPFPESVKLLRTNVSINGFGRAIRIKDFAVGAYNGQGQLYVSDKANWNRLTVGATDQPSLPVDVKRVDHVVDDTKKVDFVRMDIEGGEIEAIQGMTGLLEKHRPLLCIELHPHLVGGDGIVRMLKELGSRGYGVQYFYLRKLDLIGLSHRVVVRPWAVSLGDVVGDHGPVKRRLPCTVWLSPVAAARAAAKD